MYKIRILLTITLLSIIQINSYSQLNFWEKLTGKDKKKENIVSDEDRKNSEYHFSEGMKEFILDNYSKAIEEFKKAEKLTPENPAIHYKIADAYKEMGNYYKAEKYAKKALELEKENKYYYILLAKIYEQKQEFDKAAKIYKDLLDKMPGNEKYLFDLASIYIFQSEYEKALDIYDKIEKHYGLNEKIIFQKQKIYLKLDRLEKAIDEGRKLIKAHPDEPKYVINQAEIYLSNDKYKKAKEIINKLLDKKPNNQRARLMLADIYREEGNKEKFFNELNIAFKSKELDLNKKVEVLIKYVRQQSPEDTIDKDLIKLGKILVKEHPDQSSSYGMYADILSIDGQNEKALSNYLKSVKIDKDQFKIWQQIVRLEDQMKMTDSLIKHTNEAMKIFPNQGIFYFYNGFGNYRKKDYENAVSSFEKSKKLFTGNKEMKIQINSLLGDCYHEMEKYAKSDSAFEAVLKKDPDNPSALNNYSYYLSLRKENLQYAKKLSTKAVRKDPDNPTFLDTYGWILYQTENYKEAKKIFEKIVDETKNGTILEHYGDVLYKLGEIDKAVKHWKKAKKYGDASKNIDKKISERKLHE